MTDYADLRVPSALTFPDGLSADTIASVLDNLRTHAPRVHCITNSVAQTFTANVLLAAGAVPSMTIAPEEVGAFSRSADAVLVNLGTLDAVRRLAIEEVLDSVEATGKPWVLDPVFVDRSPVRCAYASDLMERGPWVIRANNAEYDALTGDESALPADRIIAMTGERDRIFGEGHSATLKNGHPMLARTTATGCAGGALLAACLAVEPDPFTATAAGLAIFALAGEIAGEKAKGPGSLVPLLLDALYSLERADITARLKLS